MDLEYERTFKKTFVFFQDTYCELAQRGKESHENLKS